MRSAFKTVGTVLPYPSPFPKLGKGIAQAPSPVFRYFVLSNLHCKTLYNLKRNSLIKTDK
jgi:hypothetical protein